MKRRDLKKIDGPLRDRLLAVQLSEQGEQVFPAIILCEDHTGAQRIGANFDTRQAGNVYPFLAAPARAGELLKLAKDKAVATIAEDARFAGFTDLTSNEKPTNHDVVARYRTALPDWLDGSGVHVCVLDTGYSPHPDMSQSVHVVDVTGEGDTRDHHGHGTFISAQFLARGPYPGLVPGVQESMVRMFDREAQTSYSWILKGLDVAAELDADIISMSFGAPMPNSALRFAIQDLHARGVTLVASAGNRGPGDDTVGYPGGYPEVIAVGACDVQGRLARFSSRGVHGQRPEKPDLVAEGVDLVCCSSPDGNMGSPVGSGYCQASGTSFSAPIVAALSAIVLQARPEISNEELRALLRESCRALPAAAGGDRRRAS